MENQRLTPEQQKELDTVNWRINFQQKIMEQLQTNPDIQNYFQNYNEYSVEQFINSYCQQKTYWHQHGDFYLKLQEQHELKWIEAAWWHMEAIQQKKLFDIQCMWRAEQIELPGVRLCVDFGYWQQDVLNCPFVDAITEEEIELYRQYLLQDDVELKDDLGFSSFQHYEGIKQAYLSEGEEGGNLFAWYEFYNSRKGTAHYMDLPNIRGEKESFYITLARNANPEKRAAIQEMKQVFDHPVDQPYTDRNGKELLNAFSRETLGYFVNTFEDKQTKEYYKAAAWFTRDYEEKDNLDSSIEVLLSANEDVAIEEHYDWKQAIHDAARRYTIRKISEALPDAYEQYQLNVSMNISFPCKNVDHMLAAKKTVTDDILLGRKLNGEPEDLNF